MADVPRRYASMARAARVPCPIAVITVCSPATMSPPAKTRSGVGGSGQDVGVRLDELLGLPAQLPTHRAATARAGQGRRRYHDHRAGGPAQAGTRDPVPARPPAHARAHHEKVVVAVGVPDERLGHRAFDGPRLHP